ncbi:MAG TPA: DUF433 domain-containing protein [Phycisphaerales bacterium]|nr:DUF433 domain-containing protein [Phycisphaerales bacterium]
METTDPKSPLYPYVWVDPERLSGEPCFRDTRVPVTALFDYLEAGDPLSEFLDDFPSVKKEQAEAVLRLARTWIENLRKSAAA